MNWTEIKEKYPKAWNVLLNSKHYHYGNSRCLYDFFDEQGIYVGIISSPNRYACTIFISASGEKMSQSKDIEIGSTRSEAETAAFTKAFEILEG